MQPARCTYHFHIQVFMVVIKFVSTLRTSEYLDFRKKGTISEMQKPMHGTRCTYHFHIQVFMVVIKFVSTIVRTSMTFFA